LALVLPAVVEGNEEAPLGPPLLLLAPLPLLLQLPGAGPSPLLLFDARRPAAIAAASSART